MIRTVWVIFTLLVLAPAAWAQPYAAAGGFSRPTLDAARASVASVAVTVSQSRVITTVWGAAEGVWRQDKTPGGTTEATLIIPTDDVRTVGATYVGSELVVTWVSRDRNTGIYHYHLLFEGQQRELFTESLIVPLHLFEHMGRPFGAGLFRGGGQGQIRVLDLLDTSAASPGSVVYTSDLTLRGLDVLAEPDGSVWLGWLEGKNESSEFGLISEWDAFVGYLPAADQQLLGTVSLGVAYVEDERLRLTLLAPPATALGSAPDLVYALWAEENNVLLVSTIELAGADLSVATDEQPVGVGRPIGSSWPYMYWVDGGSIVRYNVADPSLPPDNVIWSPITIEGTGFATVFRPGDAMSAMSPLPHLTAIAWFGRAQGGAIQVYSSDTRNPMALTFADRLAVLMGWSPWHFWDELIGQALTALLIGMLAAIALVPILTVVGPLLGRVLTPVRAQVFGVLTGILLLTGGAALYQIGFPSPDERRLIWLALLASGVLGAAVGWLVGRTGDREEHATFIVAGSATVFVAATVWAFLTYAQWAALVGLA